MPVRQLYTIWATKGTQDEATRMVRISMHYWKGMIGAGYVSAPTSTPSTARMSRST